MPTLFYPDEAYSQFPDGKVICDNTTDMPMRRILGNHTAAIKYVYMGYGDWWRIEPYSVYGR